VIGKLDDELVGGVYALRSFGLERGEEEGTYTLGSVVSGAGSGWRTGSATATCNLEMRRINHEGEPSPHKDCSCGVYAFNNLKMLFREYPLNAMSCVAVVSLEGTVFEHEFGYRAEKATIVAIWTGGDPSHSMENIIVDGNEEIQVYTNLEDMLSDYNLPIEPPQRDASETVRAAFSFLFRWAKYVAVGTFIAFLISLTGADLRIAGYVVVAIQMVVVVFCINRSHRHDTSSITQFLARNYSHISNVGFATYFCLIGFRSSIANMVSVFIFVAFILGMAHVFTRSIISKRERNTNFVTDALMRDSLNRR